MVSDCVVGKPQFDRKIDRADEAARWTDRGTVEFTGR